MTTPVRVTAREAPARRATPKSSSLQAVDAAVDQEQVRRLEIAVHDARAMGVAERGRDAARELDAVRDTEAVALEPSREVLALEPLHREPGSAVRRDPVGDVSHDRRMRETRERLRFAGEAVDRPSHARDGLESDGLAGVVVLRAVDLRHPAGPRELDELETVCDAIAGSGHAAIVSRASSRGAPSSCGRGPPRSRPGRRCPRGVRGAAPRTRARTRRRGAPSLP